MEAHETSHNKERRDGTRRTGKSRVSIYLRVAGSARNFPQQRTSQRNAMDGRTRSIRKGKKLGRDKHVLIIYIMGNNPDFWIRPRPSSTPCGRRRPETAEKSTSFSSSGINSACKRGRRRDVCCAGNPDFFDVWSDHTGARHDFHSNQGVPGSTNIIPAGGKGPTSEPMRPVRTTDGSTNTIPAGGKGPTGGPTHPARTTDGSVIIIFWASWRPSKPVF